MTGECDLCGLPTPEPPVTDDETPGSFCCEGCLAVSRAVEDGDGETPDRAVVRERLRSEADAGPPDADATPDDHEEAFLAIDGMHCTTCEAFVALQGESHEGIYTVDAIYATDTARVTYDPETVDADTLPEALTGYGYTAVDRRDAAGFGAESDRDTRQRLLVGCVLAFLVMSWYLFFLYPNYAGVETGILEADMTTSAGLYLPMGIVAAMSAGVVGFTGWPILRGAWIGLRTRRPNMDLLLSVAILAAFGYSLVALAAGSVHLYFDVAIECDRPPTGGGCHPPHPAGIYSETARGNPAPFGHP